MIRKLFKESAIYGLSGILSRFIGVFLIPIYTRIFAPSDYGIISLVTNLFTLLSILVILGMDNSLHRWYYEYDDEDDRKKTLNTFLMSCLFFAGAFAVLLIIFHEYLAINLLKVPDSSKPILISALNLPLTIFTAFTANLLRIQRRAVYTCVFSLVISLITVLLNILFVVVLRIGVIGIFYAQIITSIIVVIWTLILFREYISPAYFSRQRWKEMFYFSFPLVPGGIAFWVINLSGVYFIQTYANTQEVGLYQIGTAVASVMAMITSSFQMAWGPFALSIHKQTEAKKVYSTTLTLYVGITGLLGLSLTLFSSEVLRIFTTPNYYDAYLVAGILAFNYVITGIGYIAVIGTSIAKNNKGYGVASLISAAILIFLNLIFVPRFGKEGAALSTLISQSIIPVIIFWHAQKLYPIPYNFSKVVLILISSIILSFGTLNILSKLQLDFYEQLSVKIIELSVFTIFLLYLLKSEISAKSILGKVA